MKIIVVIDSVDVYGKERANIQVARVLKKRGCDVTIALNERVVDELRRETSDFNTIDIPFPRNIEGKNRRWHFLRNYFKTLASFRKLLRQVNPDYVLVPTEIALSYLYFALLSTKAKVVFRCGDSPLTYRKKGSFICWLYTPIWKHIILKRVDKLVCNSKFILNQIKESGRVDKGFDKLIYNFPPQRKITEDNQNQGDDTFSTSLKIGFLGRIVPEKGVLELVKATIGANWNGCDVALFIGGNPEIDKEYTAKIKALIEKSKGQEERILFLGLVNDVASFYSKVDIVCVPSIYEEPSANVVMEAKMYHRPALVFGTGGTPEMVSHMEDGYVCEEVSVQSLRRGIEYYYNNREAIRPQGENAYKSIEALGATQADFERKWMEVIKDNTMENIGNILCNKPCKEDLFEGKSHDKLAEVIANEIIQRKELSFIGIEGAWGSGKSNLIKIVEKKLYEKVKNKYHIFTYDAWEHQTDYPRRTLLEELTRYLVDTEILKGETWQNRCDDLLAKKRRTNTKTIPAIGVGLIISIFSILLLPLLNCLSMIVDNVWIKISILVVPNLVAYSWAIWKTYKMAKEQTENSCDKITFGKLFTTFFLIYEDKIKEDTTYETISEKEPTSKQFKLWFSDINEGLVEEEKILIVVIDDMDRLPKEKVGELWAVILSFFSEATYSNIHVIVPFDKEHLREAYKPENIGQAIRKKGREDNYYADDFINKTFSIVYSVPPPIMTSWMIYFKEMWERAFGKGAKLDSGVLQILDVLEKEPTPRKIISFINQFVTIKRYSDIEIEDKYIALYILGRDKIEADPPKEILEPSYLGGMSFLYENDPLMPERISSIHYQLPLGSAMDLIYTRKVAQELNENKVKTLERLKDRPQYWMILNHAILNVANIENATLALDASLGSDKSPEAKNVWECLIRKYKKVKPDVRAYRKYHSILLSHIRDKEAYYQSLISQYHDNIGDDFDVRNYIEGVDMLRGVMGYGDVEDDAYMQRLDTSISPAAYLTLVEERGENATNYGISVDGEELDLYMSKMSDDDIADCDIYINVKDLGSFDKYKGKVKELIKNKYNDLSMAERLLERLKEIEELPFNMNIYWDFNKLTWVARNVHIDDNLFPDIIAVTMSLWSNQNAYQLRTALSNHFNSEDETLVRAVAEVIEYYMDYGSLLLDLEHNKTQKLFVAVARNLTVNRYGESRMNLKGVLTKFDRIVGVLGMPTELLERIDEWDTTVIKIEDIQSFPTVLFVHMQNVENSLTQHCLGLANEYLSNISQEKWRDILMNNRPSFEFELLKVYHPIMYQLCFDAFKELMIGYANRDVNTGMPAEKVNEIMRIYEENGQSVIHVFTEVRDVFTGGPIISKDRLIYYGEWLLKYGKLEDNAVSLEKIFPSQLLNDVTIVQIMINNAESMKRVVDSARNTDDFCGKMRTLLTTNTFKNRKDFKNLCDLLGIE